MTPEARCPTCGRALDAPEPGAEAEEGAPWHFKLLVVSLVAYLGWRFFQIFFG